MAPRLVDSRWTVLVTALAVGALRLLGLARPVRADEAGFVLVARSWDPAPDSLYGTYFVDRPPPLIALFKVSDEMGGPLFVRVLGAVACAALVVVAAWVARLLSDGRAARLVAVAAAALVTTPLIDLVAVKGELLALPFLLGAVGLAVVAVRDDAVAAALAAGLLAAVPLGLKQNLAGGLVFVAVLLVGSRRWRLAVAALVGAAVPLAATLAWAVAAGVRVHTLWYAVYGFRADAAAALDEGPAGAPLRRALVLLVIVALTGIGAALAAYLAGVGTHWRRNRALTAAVVAMAAFDVVSLVLGGSFWQDYAFGLVPATLVALALVAARLRARLVPLMAVSTALCLLGWAVWNVSGRQELDEHDTGVALRASARDGDTLVVFGGRADVQLESGLPSPYRYLWSLPMRALDPDLDELRALLGGPQAPTWLVEWWPFDTWAAQGGELRDEVEQRYVAHGTGCGGRTIWLLKGVDRPVPEPACHG